jgi:hypothetical protein
MHITFPSSLQVESRRRNAMFRRSGSSLLGSLHRAVAAQRQATGSARDVVAAVSALPLPEKLREREKEHKKAASATAQQPALDSVPLQLAPYQALPVDGRITRHFTRGLPVVDPASRTAEVRGQPSNCPSFARSTRTHVAWLRAWTGDESGQLGDSKSAMLAHRCTRSPSLLLRFPTLCAPPGPGAGGGRNHNSVHGSTA